MPLPMLMGASRLRVKPGVGGGAQLRSFSTPEWRFLLGPQVVPGTYSATGTSNMESSLTSRYTEFVNRCTSLDGFVTQSGTIAVTNGSADIVGSGGADFTGLAGRGLRVADAGFADGFRYFQILSVQSATTAKLASYSYGAGDWQATNYQGATASGLAWAIDNTTQDGSGNAPDIFNGAYSFYDTPYCLYQAWAKADNMAGGSAALTAARDIADHLADTKTIGGWVWPTAMSLANMFANLAGFACRAHDGGKTEWFNGMKRYVDEQTAIRLANEAIGGSRAANASIFSIREGAYTLLWNAILGVVHPNTTTRNAYRDQAIALAIDPVKRKRDEFATGYVRWKNKEEGTGGEHLTASDGITAVDFNQPFISALMIEALIAVHRMMRFHGITSGANYTDIGDMIVQGVRGWYASYQQASNGFDSRLRAISYFTGDAGQKYNGSVNLVVTTPPGSPFAVQEITLPGNPTYPTDWDKIVEGRQANATGIGNIGYAHALSPGSEFLNMYHEVLASCFEFTLSNPSTYGSLWPAGQNQDRWNQHHRQCQRAAAWIVGGLETF